MGQHANISGSDRTWQRFAAKVVLIPFSDCHYWTGDTNELGYGWFKIDGRKRKAHRVAYERIHGPIDAGIVVRHRCDQPLCVNPDHLTSGSQSQNMGDAAVRRRMPLGERHWNCKLTNADLAALFSAFDRGERTSDLASLFGVSRSRISTLRHGRVGRNHPAHARRA